MVAKDDFEIGALLFDPGSGELSKPACSRRLEPKAAAVLAALCEGRGSVLARQDLLDRCWGEGEGSDEALTQTITQIRRALDDLGEDGGLIETFAKRGYRLQVQRGPVTSAPLAPSVPASIPPGSSRRSLALALAGVLTLLLLATWIMDPHGSRHFIRHSLGLGPTAGAH